MTTTSSVSEWLHGLETGDSEAAQLLWDRYFQRLMQHVEREMKRFPVRKADAEDIAASVFESLWKAAQLGRFQSVKNRDELWWLLLKMAQRKMVSSVRQQAAQKRGQGTRALSLHDDKGCGYLELISSEPSPSDVLVLNEEFSRALEVLPDRVLREIAVLTLEGHTVDEIASRLGVATATVTRKRRLIREVWKRSLE